jgi:predicted peptidase
VNRGFQELSQSDNRGRIARYVLFTPHSVEIQEPQPLILFLHGAGEIGSDGQRQVTVGLGPAIRAREHDFRFYALFPQSTHGSWRAGSIDARMALRLLDHVQSRARIDASRIYLTGVSMGAFGTFSLAAAHPDRWAAIVPICGGGDPQQARRLARVPCWCFHGGADEIVPVNHSREIIEAMRAAGGDPIYEELPGVGHNAWDIAYAKRELFEWLAQQKRRPGTLGRQTSMA